MTICDEILCVSVNEKQTFCRFKISFFELILSQRFYVFQGLAQTKRLIVRYFSTFLPKCRFFYLYKIYHKLLIWIEQHQKTYLLTSFVWAVFCLIFSKYDEWISAEDSLLIILWLNHVKRVKTVLMKWFEVPKEYIHMHFKQWRGFSCLTYKFLG